MRRFRRTLAAVAAIAVLLTALWPLATSLGYAASDEAVPLCHQAGLQVAADSMPMPDEPGAPAPRKSHCPLCVLVFFAAFAPEVAAPPYVALAIREAPAPLPAPFHRRLAVVIPGSRAPPSFLAV